MNVVKLKKQLEAIRKAVWQFLMNNIDHENWSELKRMHNRLTDDLDKLNNMKTYIDEMDSMRLHRLQALKVLKKVKKARRGKKYRIEKIDDHTYREIEVKP